jgi:uncharacterized protein YbjT (DUF2867 family)
MILVTGATGNVGREVVALLVAAGQEVRALSRDPAKAKAKFDAKVEVVPGELGNPESLAKAVDGVEAAFSLGAGPLLGTWEANLAQAAKKAGVRRIVKLSVQGADSSRTNPITEQHRAGEKAYRESGIPWTFVRPGYFMSNTLAWAPHIKEQGKVFSHFGDGKVPPVHPRDIAAVAVKALTSPGHEGKAYTVTGPELLTVADEARILSEVLGRPIQYVPVSDEVVRDGMLKSGMPVKIVDSLVGLGAIVRAGLLAEVSPDAAQVLGRKLFTYAEWARENAAAFR